MKKGKIYKNINEIIGKKFNRLTVESFAYRKPRPQHGYYYYYNCICDCGNRTIATDRCIKEGQVKSCGCLQKEIASTRILGRFTPNDYDLSGEYGIGYTSKGEEFYFDLEDYDLVRNYRWYKEKRGGYLATKSHGKNLKLHQLIFGKYCDHINGLTYDNRKENLRKCTKSENNMNKGLSSRNKSGVTGVSYSNRDKKWVAQITVKSKNIHKSKDFNNFEDAVKCRLEWEQEYFGEFAPSLNRIDYQGDKYVY